jgi:hypothetical protein
VQEITRHKNQPQLLEHARAMLNKLLEKLLYKLGTGHLDNANYEEVAMYVNYVETVVSHVAAAEDALAVLYERIGNYHRTTGNLGKALTFFEERFRLGKNSLTPIRKTWNLRTGWRFRIHN